MTTHGGIVGAVRSGSSSVASAAGGISANPEHWIARLVILAGLNAVWMHSGAPKFGHEQLVFNLCLGVSALLLEYFGTKRMTRAWYERRAGSLAGWLAIWLCAFLYSANAWLGVASEGQVEKSSIHQASFVTYSSNESELKAAKNKRDRIEGRMKWMDSAVNGSPVGTPDSAQSKIDTAKGNTKFWTMTNGCAETKGPQSRQFCENYRQALAEKALAGEKIVLQTELSAAKADVEKYERAVLNKPAVISKDRSDLRMLTSYAGFSPTKAEDTQALLKIIVISAFLALMGWVHEADKYKDQPKKPWPFWKVLRQISYKIRRALFGGSATPPDVTNVSIHGMQYHNMLAGSRA